MATITTLSNSCKYPDCEARATRRVMTQLGDVDGDYCSRHSNSRLVELAKEEGQGYHHEQSKVKAVKS